MAELNNTLFSDQEFEDMNDGLFSNAEETGPVTVLGMTFANNEERRAYFREELRKKLPELKLIEGFPIGSDEDIINLSDPPFYTACPNPWLNDFISSWEDDKRSLENQGLREKDKQVSEPYASDVSEGKNNAVYMAHGYHTKVPHLAIMRYILHYTEPGDIVFDGFSGTGMTGVAAGMCASGQVINTLNLKNAKSGIRHSICSDLSPIAANITAGYTSLFNPVEFEKKALSIIKQADDELGWMYSSKNKGLEEKINYVIWSDVFVCPNCGEEIVFWKEAVDLNSETIKDSFACPHCGSTCSKKNMSKAMQTSFDSNIKESITVAKKVPVRINYTLSGKRGERDVNDDDLKLINRIEDFECANWFPTDKMMGIGAEWGDTWRAGVHSGISRISQFYTRRNLIYLSKVYKLIKDDVVLMSWFTSIQQNASNMYKFRMDRKGGILNGTFFIPSLSIEQNPSRLLKGKINDFKMSYYEGRGNSAISVCSATDLATIRNESIDYIFIDPPFGENIMYSELNSLWESWLRVKTNNKEEAIVSPSQKKTLFEYQTLMNRSLTQFYRILKSGKWLTMEFSNTSAAVWNSIQNALQGVGFVVANVSALDKKQGSFKAVTTPTAVKQDLIITCYKPSNEIVESVLNEEVNISIWEFVNEYLEHLPVHICKGNATTSIIERSPKILFDRLITYYVQKGLPVPIDAQDFQNGLKDRYLQRDGMYFTPAQAAMYEEKKKSTIDFVPMGLIVSNEADGIEWLKIHLDKPKTYAEIQPDWMQAINGVRKNDILPELSVLLDENFIQEDDGKWRLPNIQDDVDKFKLRTKALLKEFKLYVEQASKPKAKIKEVRVEAVRAGFKQCYIDKDFQTIVTVGDKIPQNLLEEDEILLQFYDIAVNHI